MGARCSNLNRKQKKSKSKATYSYTGLCSAADRKSPRPVDLNPENIDKDQLLEAAQLVQQFLVGLQNAITKRRATISTLRDMANLLDKVQKDVNIAKVTGSSTAVGGGVVAVLGGILSVLTLGAALPLVGLGIGTAVVGSVTSGGAEIVGLVISKNKMEEAQKVLDEDKAALEKIDDHYTKLTCLAEKISVKNPQLGTSKEIICMLLVGNKLQSTGTNGSSALGVAEFTVASVLLIGLGTVIVGTAATMQSGNIIGRKIVTRLGSKLANVFSKGVAQSAGRVARTVLRGLATVALLGFDIYDMVKVSIDINNGSKSAAAESIRKIADGFLEQVKEMEEFLEELRKQSEELGKLLKEEFQKLLETIARRGEALEEEVVQAWNYIQMHKPNEAWVQAFNECMANPQMYISNIARIFDYIKQKIEEYEKKEEEEEEKNPVIDLIFIAHGQIMNPLHPCSLNYFNESVESITLYEPWGCAVDASVVYGIATGTINIGNVHYSDIVKPNNPSDWNTLPRDSTLVPMVVFSHVTTDEGAYKMLDYIASVLGSSSRRLVIQYFQHPGVTILPDIPLWALSNAVAIAGFLLNKRFRIHVAACLVADDESILTRADYPSLMWPTVACRQYRTVQVKRDERVFMSYELVVPAPLWQAFAVLDTLL